MRTARTVCTLAVLFLVASPVYAAAGTKKAAPKTAVKYYTTIDKTLQPVTLTDEQSAKLDALKKDYEQKFKDAYAKVDVLTPDQKKAGDEARKAAKDAGESRQEINKAAADAEKLTDEQKAKRKNANKELTALRKEFHGKVFDLLTAEQKQQIADAQQMKAGKAAAPATPAAPAKPAEPAARANGGSGSK